jgi:hypothetical protein
VLFTTVYCFKRSTDAILVEAGLLLSFLATFAKPGAAVRSEVVHVFLGESQGSALICPLLAQSRLSRVGFIAIIAVLFAVVSAESSGSVPFLRVRVGFTKSLAGLCCA